jgi:UDP-N-acetylmuramoyl-tripeptide--D-alanyl-D-alanine ligase
VLVAVGDHGALYVEGAEGVVEVAIASDADQAAGIVCDLIRPGDCVLVKGSRVVGLEVVADALAGAGD